MRIKISLAILVLFLNSLVFARKVYYGYSSWYGDRFHGRKTASGELYDMHKLTAAHRELPFHTYLKVTNLQNNKTVIVKVNDRGPYKHNRIIDLSRAAAEKLDFIDQGLTRVRIEVLGEPDEKTMNDPIIDNKNKEVEANTKKRTNHNKSEPEQRKNENVNKKSQYENAERKESSDNDKNYENNNEYYNSELDRSKQYPLEKTKKKENKQSLQRNRKVNLVEKKYFGSIKYYLVDTKKLVKKRKRLFKIQLGAFSNIKYAANRQTNLNTKGIQTLLCLFKNDTRYFRILTKQSFPNERKAKEHIKHLDQKGISAFILEIK